MLGILVITLLFTVIHIQYNWFGLLQVFMIGLLLTWTRWRSGSTLLPMVMHVITNFYAMLQAVVYFRWFVMIEYCQPFPPDHALGPACRGAPCCSSSAAPYSDGGGFPVHAVMRHRAEQVAVLPLHRPLQVERAPAAGIEQPRAGLERKLAGERDVAPAGQALGAALGAALFDLAHAAAHRDW